MSQIREHGEIETVVRSHAGWVHACANRRVGNEAMAEDVVQAVFVLFWRRRGRLGKEVRLTRWLYRAVRYCAANTRRLEQVRERHEREAAMAGLRCKSSGEAGWSEVSPELEQAVDRLGERDRMAVLMRFYRQMSFAEVGRCLGISEDAAQKRVERAVGKLREKLAGKGVEVEAGSLGAMALAHAVEGGGAAGLVEKVMAGIGDGAGNGTAGLIAKEAEKMMVYAKAKVAMIWTGIALSLVGAAVYAGNANATSGGTPAPQTSGQQAATNPEGEKLLSFPAGVTLGTLYLRDKGPHEYASNDWTFLAPAAGQVRIPAGKQVELRVSSGAVGQLASLKTLPTNVIYRVMLDFTDVDDNAVAEVSHLTGLTSLSLRQTRQVTDRVAATIGKLTALEDLNLESTATGPECLAAIESLKNLRCLGLGGTKISDADMRHLAALGNLQTLNLGYTQISDEGVMLLGDLRKLRLLWLFRTRVTDRATHQIAKWTNLESLDVEDTAITDDGMAVLSNLPHLKELRIGQTRITDAGMADVAAIATLEKLKLPEGITNAGLAALGDHASLNRIEGMAAMDDQTLAILAHLPALESIELSGPRITDAGMEQVANMRSLRELALSECAVTDEGFARLGSLQSLEKLSLTGTHITPQGLVLLKTFTRLTLLRLGDGALVHGGLKHAAGIGSIKTLCLQGNALAIDDGVLADVGQLPALNQLIVQNWSAPQASISDAGVAQLGKLTKLGQLHLDTPGTLTDRSLVSLSGLRELGFLRVHGAFTDSGLRALEGMPSLSSLLLPGQFSDGAKESLQKHTPSLRGFIILEN